MNDLDSNFCGYRWDYSCSVYYWPACTTQIPSTDLYVSSRDVYMRRNVLAGWSHQVCFKCTGNGMTLQTSSAWSVTLDPICTGSMSDYNTNLDETKQYDATITSPESVLPGTDFTTWFIVNSDWTTENNIRSNCPLTQCLLYQ